MSFLGQLLRRPRIGPRVPWEKTNTAKTPRPSRQTRRYLEHSDYQLPKDALEDDRLNFQHHALFHAIGNHYVAPLSLPLHTILDVGTGTGIWANEMARLFPTSVVVGLDLAPSSFKEATPDNCLLRVGNVLTGLPFPDGFFSFTHQRLLVAGLTAENWLRAIHELVRVTRPHGWLELVEADDQTHNAGPASLKMQEMLRAVNRQLGFDGEVIRHLGDLLVQEQLQEVEVQPIRIPMGEWGGRVGSMMRRDILAALAAMCERYAPLAGITEADFTQLVHTAAAEWEKYRSSCTFYAVYGKRGPI